MTQAPTVHPTMPDIYRAAAWWAGEGSAVVNKNRGLAVTVGQKELDVLQWFLDRFGGSIHRRKVSAWTINGPRARGFLMTIYSCIPESPRRQAQIRSVLLATNGIRKRGYAPRPTCHLGHEKPLGERCRVCDKARLIRHRSQLGPKEKHRLREQARYYAKKAQAA